MNNTAGMNTRINRVNAKARKAPAWLVMLAHVILFFAKEETLTTIKAASALGTVLLIAMFAGGISCGVVPLGYGVVICASLVAIAMLLTRDFV